jgi:GntR family transcriptional repressor for pyruvate dehydrogenase complex
MSVPTEAANRTDSLAAELRDAILRGTYSPGDRLPAERELAARHSLNRASVREALKKLEQLRLVDIRRGGGARVCPVHEASVDIISHLLHVDGQLDASLALQIFDVLEIMVAGAARLAMQRASESELLEARDLLRRLDASGTHLDARLSALDDLFELITRASDNLVLRMLYTSIRPAITGELGRILCGALLGTRGEQSERLRAIEDALVARDPVAAEEAVRLLQRDERARLWKVLTQDGASKPTT